MEPLELREVEVEVRVVVAAVVAAAAAVVDWVIVSSVDRSRLKEKGWLVNHERWRGNDSPPLIEP